ncbi:MAG: hypothetical protein JSW34_06035 [Candidatus Zixiibacteriota bacterium]|nr:MAG: hypothetical protein JSW34_06035 [candidate division Zixibacteria bacterium]
MGLVLSINYFLTLFLDTFRRLGGWRIWLVLGAYFLFEWLFLFAHYKFYWPVLIDILQPWLRLVNGQNAAGYTHYPGHFLLLPDFFDWTRFAVSILVKGVVLGVVAVLFSHGYTRGGQGYGRLLGGRTVFIWAQMVAAWLLVGGLVVIIYSVLPEMLSSSLAGAPRRIFFFKYMLQPALHIGALATVYFVIPVIAVRRVNFLRAVARSLTFFWRTPFTCLFLSAIIFFGHILLVQILARRAALVESFPPESIYWLLIAGLAMDIVIGFFWMGTASRYLVDQD